MPVDERFLEILTCPVTRQKLQRLDEQALEELNRQIRAGGRTTLGGNVMDNPIAEALVTEDQTRIYRVLDGIPILLEEEAIGYRNAG